jgi:parallel beta-helix repeat protein
MLKHRFGGAVLALALMVAGAHAATLPATPATFASQLAAAKPGDVVELQSGAWGVLALDNAAKTSPGVTIQPAAGVAVKVAGISTPGATWITVQGLEVAYPNANATATVIQGDHITLRKLYIHPVDQTVAAGRGIAIWNANYATLDGNVIDHAGIGIDVEMSTGSVITGNEVRFPDADFLDLYSAGQTQVAANWFHDPMPGTGHPDFTQLDYSYSDPVHDHCFSGNVITGNRFDRGKSTALPNGVFGIGQCGITISGNVIRGANGNGIYVDAAGAAISANFVQGYSDYGSRIIISGTNAKVTGNAANAYADNGVNLTLATDGSALASAADVSAGIAVGAGNVTVLQADYGDDSALMAWQAATATTSTTVGSTSTATAPDPLQATVDALTSQVASLQAQLAAAPTQATVDGLNAQIATLKTQITTLASKIASAQSILSAKTANTTSALSTKITKALAALK